jgi:hypothetical protein
VIAVIGASRQERLGTPMLVKPQFKAHYHAEVIPPETVYLLSEKDHAALSGRLYVLLAPLLDGRHTVADLVKRLDGQATAAEVYYALMQLEGKGHLVEATDGVLPPEAAPARAIAAPRQILPRGAVAGGFPARPDGTEGRAWPGGGCASMGQGSSGN